MEKELAGGKTSLLRTSGGRAAAAGGKDKEMLIYLDAPKAIKCLFNFTLENRIISITWLKVQKCLIVQDLMWCSCWTAVCGCRSSSISNRPCGTPCCRQGGTAAAPFQLLVVLQSLNQLIFGARDCQTLPLQFRPQIYDLTDDEHTRKPTLKDRQDRK